MQSEFDRAFEIAVDAARARGVRELELIYSGENAALTRFANNAVHQNVAERSTNLSVRPVIDGRTARSTTNRRDPDGIRAAVDEAIDLARLTEPDPELPQLADPQPIAPADRYVEATAHATPDERARGVASAIVEASRAGLEAAGIYSTGEAFFGVRNSRGVDAWHSETMARFSITAMAGDSSGWAKSSACDHRRLDPTALARSAVQKTASSSNPIELPNGRYTVILEPAAVLDLVGQLFADFSATAIRDGRSFLVDRIGQRLFGTNITVQDDAHHPLQSGPPFDGEGVPRRLLTLIDQGIARDIAYSRQAAALDGAAPTGHGLPVPNEIGEFPANIVIAGGDTSIDQMIASTHRGILVTRFWYIREVDPYEKIFTGMTRDGTFLITNGRLSGGLRNFRFNQNLLELLSSVKELSPSVRASGEEAADMVVPAMLVHDFNFTEVTRF